MIKKYIEIIKGIFTKNESQEEPPGRQNDINPNTEIRGTTNDEETINKSEDINCTDLIIQFMEALKKYLTQQSKANDENKAIFFTKSPKILINIIAIFAILLAICLLCIEASKEVVLIEPFSVSKELKDQGYSGDTIRNIFNDKINIIRGTIKTRKECKNILPANVGKVNFNILGSGISLDSIIQFLRRIFGTKTEYIGGEIVRIGKNLYLIVRYRGNSQQENKLYQEPIKICIELINLDKHLLEAAESTFRQLDPFILAAYYYKKESEQLKLKKKIRGKIKQILPNKPNENSRFFCNMGYTPLVLMEWITYVFSKDTKFSQTKEIIEHILDQRNDEDTHWALNLWGVILKKQGKHKEAGEKFADAIEIDNEFALPYNNWGNALSAQNNCMEAIKKYQNAAKLDRQFASPYSNWAYVAFKQKEYKKAIRLSKKAVRIDPKHSPAYIQWGNALCELGGYKKSIEKYKEAIRLNRNCFYAYNNMGWALSKLERYGEAEKQYQEAIKIDPTDPLPYSNWGEMLLDQKKYDPAIVKFREAIEWNKKYAEAYYGWGLALKYKGEIQDALGKLREAAEYDPKGETGKKARAEIEELKKK